MKYLLIIFTTFCLTIGQTLGQETASVSKKAKIESLEERVKSLEETKEKWFSQPAFIIAVLGAAFAIGAGALVRAKLKEVVTERLSKELNVPHETLKAALADFSKDFGAKNKTQILVISQNEGQNFGIRSLLQKDGFNIQNHTYYGIKDDIQISNTDIILFNDMLDSKLKIKDIESVIKNKKTEVKLFFYLGANNDLPMKKWRDQYQINITGANFEDTLAFNLSRSIKSHIQLPK